MIKVSIPASRIPKFPSAYKLIPSRGESPDKNLVVLFFSESVGVTIVAELCDSSVTGEREGWVRCTDTQTWKPVDVKISA